GRHLWIDPLPPASFLNHSCEASAGIRGRVTLTALRDIAKGEEVTLDYATTESDPHWAFDCRCGVPGCRGIVRAIQTLPRHLYQRYLPCVPRHFQGVYMRYHTTSHDR